MSDVNKADLLIINDAFYRAFEEMDLQKMQQVWSQVEGAFCVHPGWEILRGWREVNESWLMIFENTGYMRFQLSDVEAGSNGEMGWVSCIENIYTVAAGQAFHSSVAALNLFVRVDGEWKILAHHGSAISNHTVEDGGEEMN